MALKQRTVLKHGRNILSRHTIDTLVHTKGKSGAKEERPQEKRIILSLSSLPTDENVFVKKKCVDFLPKRRRGFLQEEPYSDVVQRGLLLTAERGSSSDRKGPNL